MRSETENILFDFIAAHGEEALIKKLVIQETDSTNTLTIIANAGVHPYHDLHKRGDVFVASQGNLDFSTAQSAKEEIEKVLIHVSKKLAQNRWTKVYLVPFGPAPLSLQIKSLVNKVLDIETVDVLHTGNGVHVDIQIDPRKIAINAQGG